VRRDQSDVPVLRAITAALGSSIWFNCMLVLTHAAAAPPDGANGPLTYEVYTNQRTHALQQAIRWRSPGPCCSNRSRFILAQDLGPRHQVRSSPCSLPLPSILHTYTGAWQSGSSMYAEAGRGMDEGFRAVSCRASGPD
jgi:hypothetical protein